MLLTLKLFSMFHDWNIDMILFSKKFESKYALVKLEKLITPRAEKVKPVNIPSNRLIISKIRFSDGNIFFNNRIIKSDMNKSCLNDLLVSNINFEKGAFNVNTFGDVYASTDYTSYIIDTKSILPEYLFRVLRCPLFIKYVASVKPKGMKTRARYSFIKEFEIPLPSIPEQKRILAKYHSTLAMADKADKDGNRFSEGLLFDIQSMVSNLENKEASTEKSNSIIQTVPFSKMSRWDVAYTLKEEKLKHIYDSFKYPYKQISEITNESLFGLSAKASLTKKSDMIPMLRMSNIVNGEIDCSNLKYLPYKCAVTSKEPDKWLLKKGDFLINRTNSKELVGKASVFNLNGDYTYASYVIRYRFDTAVVLPEYVNIIFMLPIVRIQIDTISRQTAGQCNINSDEIGSIRIPVPPLTEQQDIIDKYYSAKDGANAFYTKADELRQKATDDFEKSIFTLQ